MGQSNIVPFSTSSKIEKRKQSKISLKSSIHTMSPLSPRVLRHSMYYCIVMSSSHYQHLVHQPFIIRLWLIITIVLLNVHNTCCNIQPAFLSKETLMDVIAIILYNLNYLENLPRTLFLLFSNLGRINYTHLVLPLSGIMSKLILATSRIMIIIHTTTLPLRKLSTEKSLLLFHPVLLKNKWKNQKYMAKQPLSLLMLRLSICQ